MDVHACDIRCMYVEFNELYSPQIFIDPVIGYLAIIYPEIISRANIAALARRRGGL